MANVTNIPTGLGVPTQIPLDTVAFNQSESLLSNLGTDNYLAFKYYEGLVVHCINDKTTYIWREVEVGEENTGLIAVDFTYPNNHIVYGIDYSNRVFNFFQIEYVSVDDIITYTGTNIGNGSEILKDITGTSTKTFNFKKINSDNLTIIDNGDDLTINTPSTASMPALYVNNLYQPTYAEWLTENTLQNSGTPINGFVFRGKGTLAQPFTDSTVYPLAGGSATVTSNTAIENALDGDSAYAIPYSYVGSTALSYSRLNPQRNGQQIIVQNNNSFYTFLKNFSYNNLKIEFNSSVLCTTSDYIVDMDNPLYFNSISSIFEITVNDGFLLECSDSLGFRNSGTTDTTLPVFSTGRIGFFKGNGAISFNYNGVDVLKRYIFNGGGNANNGNLHFRVKTEVRAEKQGIYFSKNKNSIDFYKPVTSGVLNGSGNINLKAFHMEGGQIRFYEEGFIYLANHTSGRIYGVTFEPKAGGIGFCIFQLNSGRVAGTSQNCFAKLNNEHVDFLAFNSPSGDSFSTTLTGTSTLTNGLFENLGATPWQISFKNNVFSFTGIDQAKVDLTQGNSTSTINFIGGSVLENLVIHDNRASAILAGVPLYSAYIKTNGSTYPFTATWVRDIVLPS